MAIGPLDLESQESGKEFSPYSAVGFKALPKQNGKSRKPSDASSHPNAGKSKEPSNASSHPNVTWIKTKNKRDKGTLSDGPTWVRELESYERSNNKVEEKPKIQKVSSTLRNIKYNEKCYDPMVVSIGPYHHGKSELKQMEYFKIQFALEYAHQSRKRIEELHEIVGKMLIDAKNRYVKGSNKVFHNDESFAKMMFIDSCFVVQFIYSYWKPQKNHIKTRKADTTFIVRDILLLENQLPFEIVIELMNLRFGKNEAENIIDNFINGIILKGFNAKEAPKVLNGTSEGMKEPSHLLELVWTKYIGDESKDKKDSSDEEISKDKKKNKKMNSSDEEISKDKKKNSSLNWCLYRTINELRSVGIHFRHSMSHRFSDITFNPACFHGWLRVPPITIEDSTKSLLLNLVAFEESSNTLGVVSSYVYFMDTLIDRAEDVKELRSNGIILNLLGSDEQVANLFNEIAENVVPDIEVFGEVKDSLNNYYRSRLRLWLTECLHNYFSSPWTMIAFLAAILALGLTATQTIFSATSNQK